MGRSPPRYSDHNGRAFAYWAPKQTREKPRIGHFDDGERQTRLKRRAALTWINNTREDFGSRWECGGSALRAYSGKEA